MVGLSEKHFLDKVDVCDTRGIFELNSNASRFFLDSNRSESTIYAPRSDKVDLDASKLTYMSNFVVSLPKFTGLFFAERCVRCVGWKPHLSEQLSAVSIQHNARNAQ